MSLDIITAGDGLVVVIFWSIGAFILGMGLLDTILTERDRDYD